MKKPKGKGPQRGAWFRRRARLERSHPGDHGSKTKRAARVMLPAPGAYMPGDELQDDDLIQVLR